LPELPEGSEKRQQIAKEMLRFPVLEIGDPAEVMGLVIDKV
jgi:hypothetical protein